MASTNTQKVNERLQLAEQAAAAGNFAAAVNYANAAAAYSKSTTSNANVQNIISAYTAARDQPAPTPSNPPPSSPSGGDGGGGGYVSSGATTYSAPAPAPVPILPTFRPMTITNKNFKVAPTDIIQFDDESVEIALIQDLLFEDIGATELANMSRSDLIDGQESIYSPIKNLGVIRREFNSNNIIATSFTSDYFSRFGIDMISRGMYDPYVNSDGNIIIEIDSVEDDEEIQVEIVSNGTISMVEES